MNNLSQVILGAVKRLQTKQPKLQQWGHNTKLQKVSKLWVTGKIWSSSSQSVVADSYHHHHHLGTFKNVNFQAAATNYHTRGGLK